jgi:hypothetical protein
MARETRTTLVGEFRYTLEDEGTLDVAEEAKLSLAGLRRSHRRWS